MAGSASCRGEGASCSGKPLPVGAYTVGSSPPILAPPPPGSAPPRRSAAALRVPGSAASRCDSTHQQLVFSQNDIDPISNNCFSMPSNTYHIPSVGKYRLHSSPVTCLTITDDQLIVGGSTFGNVAIANQTFVM
ncbi:hypothetical protein U9M48_028672 [Paspalum notatum var. saurae]|uniref:Uncharacterized protein n=1 Tax=Paspalum notatum var. saurae TaxID=547442 RepID=A0AAQ3TZ04_PASNO